MNKMRGGKSLMVPLRRKKPPGAMLRYDGRLTTPSACLRIVKGFTVFRQCTQP